MKVKIFPAFRTKLLKQLDFIAADKPVAAKKFQNDIFELVDQISSMPYKHRQSIYYTDKNIRDIVLKVT